MADLERKDAPAGTIGVVSKTVLVSAGKVDSRAPAALHTAGRRKGRGPIAAPGLLPGMASTVPNTAREIAPSAGDVRGESTVPGIFIPRAGLKDPGLENQGRVGLGRNKI